jgi:acyl-coenzyme A synthetase/AMP-(fatty) acid ligase
MNNWLLEKCQQYGDSQALIVSQESYSYQDIVNRSKEYDDIIQIKAGSVLYIKGNYNVSTVSALLWGITKNIIIIPVSLQSWDNTAHYFDIIPPNLILNCEDDRALPTIIQHSDKPYQHLLTDDIIANKDSGLILFSSGTTGLPKAAVHNFNKFLDKFSHIEKKFRSIAFLNIDHIGGLNTLFSVLPPGGLLALPISTQPNEVCDVIEKYQIDLLPTTPSFLRMLLMSQSIHKYDLSSLKTISYGTEFMPEDNLIKLKKALPNVSFKQTYGSTEIGILPTKSKQDDSTWFRIDNDKSPYKIIDDILWIKSKSKSLLGYLNAAFEIQDDWVNTHDRVLQDGEYLKILGRATELINVGGNKVDPHEVEDILLQCAGVKDVAVFGKASPILGQIVMAKISYQPDIDPDLLKIKLHTWCKQHLETFKRPAVYIFEKDITYSSRWKKVRE